MSYVTGNNRPWQDGIVSLGSAQAAGGGDLFAEPRNP